MGIFDRIGDVLKSYINDADEPLFGKPRQRQHSGDPDLDAAFDELDDFLGGPGKRASKDTSGDDPFADLGGGRASGSGTAGRSGSGRPVPAELRGDFDELGVAFGASAEDCKTAYKKLLKIHHPDRHAGHPGNMKKATEKSARINAAYDRIEKWRATGRV
ncbi:hypothetical protein FACS189493_8220 [Spirochaetia bacterium]|nr:hypothetical protein FACS189493_8220 [Spirochaetia bacterium]